MLKCSFTPSSPRFAVLYTRSPKLIALRNMTVAKLPLVVCDGRTLSVLTSFISPPALPSPIGPTSPANSNEASRNSAAGSQRSPSQNFLQKKAATTFMSHMPVRGPTGRSLFESSRDWRISSHTRLCTGKCWRKDGASPLRKRSLLVTT